MSVSQRCQYALRAILELSQRNVSGPLTVAEIAVAQGVPRRFLEAILVQLKNSGIVESRRGMRGGYLLAVSPADLTVGQVIRCVDGPVMMVKSAPGEYPPNNGSTFEPLWKKARLAVEQVYDSTTFQDLVDKQRRVAKTYVGSNI